MLIKINAPVVTASDSYSLCISRVQNAELKRRLESVKQIVTETATEYEDLARQKSLHQLASHSNVGDVTKKEMEEVYVNRMAKSGAPGRAIYDKIRSSSPQGRCPLCAQRQVTTVDHHLPKAHFPALAVTPLNLVPSCRDCNETKNDCVPRNASEVMLHPYFDFDDVGTERWLVADVVEVHPAVLTFKVSPPASWSSTLAERVNNHFRVLGLPTLYASEAAEELINLTYQLGTLHATTGAKAVRAHLVDYAASCRKARPNGWRTAAYEAWASNDWFCSGGFKPAP